MAVPLLIGSTIASSYSSYKSGKAEAQNQMMMAQSAQSQSEAEARNFEAQAESDAINRAFRELQAANAINLGNLEANMQRRDARQVLSLQRASLAEAGILDSVTADDLTTQSAIEAELDNLIIKYNAKQESTGLLFEAEQLQRQSDQNLANADATRRTGRINVQTYQSNAANARRAGNLGVITGLLAGATQYQSLRNQSNLKRT